MARQPYRTLTFLSYTVKAKNLKKKDRIPAFGGTLTVLSVHNNRDGTCGVTLKPWYGASDEPILVVFPSKFKVKVTDSESHNLPENR